MSLVHVPIFFSNLFFFIFCLVLRTLLCILLRNNVISAELFKCEARLPRLALEEQNKIVNAISQALVVIICIFFPLIQTLLSLVAHGILPEAQVKSVIDTMLLLEISQTIGDAAHLDSMNTHFIKEHLFLFFCDIPTPFILNLVSILLLHVVSDFSKLSLVHCVWWYQCTVALTSFNDALRSLDRLSHYRERPKRLTKCYEILDKADHMLWQTHRVVEVLILAKTVFNQTASYLEYIYIFALPVIFHFSVEE